MNKITITLPKGCKATDIVERGEGDDYFVDINYIEDSEMCKIRQPHEGFDCKCNKEDDRADQVNSILKYFKFRGW